MQIKKIIWGILTTLILAVFFFLPGLISKSGKQKSCEIVFFGDSMIGQARGEDGIASLLEEKTGKKVLNAAFGGTNMARVDTTHSLAKGNDCFSMVALAEAACYKDFGPQQTITITENGTEYFADLVDELSYTDFSKAKIILIEQGTNDYNSGVPLTQSKGDEDTYTFEGALRKSIRLVQKMAPGARIIIVTPTFCWFPPKETDCEGFRPVGYCLMDYVELEKKVAKELGVEVIDHYDLFEHDSFDRCFEYTIDGLHANEYGRELIAESIADYISGTEGNKQ